ncbi:his operon leader peptide [Superficieibacter sp. BNK-5]
MISVQFKHHHHHHHPE